MEVLDRRTRRSVAATPPLFLASVVEAIVPYDAAGGSEQEAAVERAIDFVHHQLGALPPSLRLLLRVGLLGFRSWILLRHLRDFRMLDLDARRAIVRGWSYGPWPPARQLFRALRGTALLAYYDAPHPAGEPASR